MSGDNLLHEQPLKFYSEEVTKTKIVLVHHLLKSNAKRNSIIDLERNQKDWGKDIAI